MTTPTFFAAEGVSEHQQWQGPTLCAQYNTTAWPAGSNSAHHYNPVGKAAHTTNTTAAAAAISTSSSSTLVSPLRRPYGRSVALAASAAAVEELLQLTRPPSSHSNSNDNTNTSNSNNFGECNGRENHTRSNSNDDSDCIPTSMNTTAHEDARFIGIANTKAFHASKLSGTNAATTTQHFDSSSDRFDPYEKQLSQSLGLCSDRVFSYHYPTSTSNGRTMSKTSSNGCSLLLNNTTTNHSNTNNNNTHDGQSEGGDGADSGGGRPPLLRASRSSDSFSTPLQLPHGINAAVFPSAPSSGFHAGGGGGGEGGDAALSPFSFVPAYGSLVGLDELTLPPSTAAPPLPPPVMACAAAAAVTPRLSSATCTPVHSAVARPRGNANHIDVPHITTSATAQQHQHQHQHQSGGITPSPTSLFSPGLTHHHHPLHHRATRSLARGVSSAGIMTPFNMSATAINLNGSIASNAALCTPVRHHENELHGGGGGGCAAMVSTAHRTAPGGDCGMTAATAATVRSNISSAAASPVLLRPASGALSRLATPFERDHHSTEGNSASSIQEFHLLRKLTATGMITQENRHLLQWGCFGLLVALGDVVYVRGDDREPIRCVHGSAGLLGASVSAVASTVELGDGRDTAFIAVGMTNGAVMLYVYKRETATTTMSSSSSTTREGERQEDGVLPLAGGSACGRMRQIHTHVLPVSQCCITSIQVVDNTLYVAGMEGVLALYDMLSLTMLSGSPLPPHIVDDQTPRQGNAAAESSGSTMLARGGPVHKFFMPPPLSSSSSPVSAAAAATTTPTLQPRVLVGVGEPIFYIAITDDKNHVAVGTNQSLLVYHASQLQPQGGTMPLLSKPEPVVVTTNAAFPLRSFAWLHRPVGPSMPARSSSTSLVDSSGGAVSGGGGGGGGAAIRSALLLYPGGQNGNELCVYHLGAAKVERRHVLPRPIHTITARRCSQEVFVSLCVDDAEGLLASASYRVDPDEYDDGAVLLNQRMNYDEEEEDEASERNAPLVTLWRNPHSDADDEDDESAEEDENEEDEEGAYASYDEDEITSNAHVPRFMMMHHFSGSSIHHMRPPSAVPEGDGSSEDILASSATDMVPPFQWSRPPSSASATRPTTAAAAAAAAAATRPSHSTTSISAVAAASVRPTIAISAPPPPRAGIARISPIRTMVHPPARHVGGVPTVTTHLPPPPPPPAVAAPPPNHNNGITYRAALLMFSIVEDAQGRGLLVRLKGYGDAGKSRHAVYACASPDGACYATAGPEALVHVWRPADHRRRIHDAAKLSTSAAAATYSDYYHYNKGCSGARPLPASAAEMMMMASEGVGGAQHKHVCLFDTLR